MYLVRERESSGAAKAYSSGIPDRREVHEHVSRCDQDRVVDNTRTDILSEVLIDRKSLAGAESRSGALRLFPEGAEIV